MELHYSFFFSGAAVNKSSPFMSRDQKLAAKLRENLKRRKAQAKQRAAKAGVLPDRSQNKTKPVTGNIDLTISKNH